MRCFNDILSSTINGTCNNKTPFFDSRGYLIPVPAITNRTQGDYVIENFEIPDPSDIIPVFMEMDMPYKLGAEFTKNDFGIVSGDKTVELFIAKNTPLSAKQVMQLNNGAYILAMYDQSKQIILVGADRGLRLTATSQEISSAETHGGIVVTMTEVAAMRPQVFSNDIDIIQVLGVELSDYTISIPVGSFADVTYGFIPVSATIRAINVVSMNTGIATVVDAFGDVTITGINAGTTTVVVYSVDGNFKAEVTVTVTAV